MNKKESETFLNYPYSCLADYLQEKINFNSVVHRKYNKKYDEVSQIYPNVIKALEDVDYLDNIEFTKEEMKAILTLRKLELQTRSYENEICFKLGINEILNFKI